MYEQLYQAKLNDIKKKKDQSLAGLASEEQATNNQYTDLYNQLKTKQEDAKTGYYNQRNEAAVGNAQNVQQMRDWMASKNLLQSGESADAYMRANTDFSNNLGRIKTNEDTFNRDIMNQNSTAQREQAQKIADIYNRRRLTEEGATGDEQALRSEVEYQRLQAAQAAASARRSSGGSSSRSSSGVAKTDKVAVQKQVEEAFNTAETVSDMKNFLDQNGEEIIKQAGQATYDKLYKKWVDNYTMTYRTSPFSGVTVVGSARH